MTIRERYINAGLIQPLPTPLTADELDLVGFHAAAAAKRKGRNR